MREVGARTSSGKSDLLSAVIGTRASSSSGRMCKFLRFEVMPESMRQHVVCVRPLFANFGQSHDLTASRTVTQYTPPCQPHPPLHRRNSPKERLRYCIDGGSISQTAAMPSCTEMMAPAANLCPVLLHRQRAFDRHHVWRTE
jgi:hypothetical protein